MPEPGDTGSTERAYHCANCGNDFSVEPGVTSDGSGECPVCGFQCTPEQCTIRNTSDVDF